MAKQKFKVFFRNQREFNKTKITTIEGYPITFDRFPGYTFFVHKSVSFDFDKNKVITNDKYWEITEQMTGMLIVTSTHNLCKTKKEAIQTGEKLLIDRTKGLRKLDDFIIDSMYTIFRIRKNWKPFVDTEKSKLLFKKAKG